MTPAAPVLPPLAADELRPLRWLLGGLLSLLGAASILHTDVDAGPLLGFAGVVIVTALVRPDLPARVPRIVHVLAFPGILGCFVLDLWLELELLPSLVRLALLLLTYRSLGYRGRREDLQVLTLGLFLVIVAGVLSVSPAFAVHLLVYGAGGLLLLLVLTLEAGGRPAVAAPPAESTEAPAWARRVRWRGLLRRWRAALDWRFALAGAGLFAVLVAGTAVLFLAIPRFQLEGGLFLNRVISKKAKSGFSESVQLGEIAAIQLDQGLALTVDVSDPAAVPVQPYWRMMVLDEYAEGTFRMSPALRGQFGSERTAAQLSGSVPPGEERARWTFYLEPGVSRSLPLAGPFERLRFREVQHFRPAPGLGLLALREDPVAMLAFRVEGLAFAPMLRDPAFVGRWRRRDPTAAPGAGLQAGLPVAEQDRLRLRRILEEMGWAGGAAPEFGRRASDWLRARHAYTLAPLIPPGPGDPVVRWAGSREAGHCELFAGALVLLARSAGFPARMVTGFRGGSWNGYSQNLTVRNSDAHAWVEILDEGAGGWRRIDPLAAMAEGAAPELAGAVAAAARPDHSWNARWDSLRVFWYRRVVNFDQRSQLESARALAGAALEWLRAARAAATESLGTARAWAARPWDGARLGAAAGIVFLGALTLRFGRRWRRSARGAGGRAAGVRTRAGRWLKRLNGVPADPDHAGLRSALERLRFGAEGGWPDPEATFRRARRLRWRARARRGTPRWLSRR